MRKGERQLKKIILLCLLSVLMTSCNMAITQENIETAADETESVSEETETEQTEKAAETYETVETSAIGTRMCHAHIMEYHFYPSDLIDYIGDRFYDWVREVESTPDSDKTDDCPYSHCNIIECLKYFDISEEVFTELYYTKLYYSCHYDPEIMYSGDDGEIQKFFLGDNKEAQDAAEKDLIRDAKRYLKDELLELSADEETIEKYNGLPRTAWTLPDLIRDAKISRAALDIFLNDYKSFGKAFDWDAIYEEAEKAEKYNSETTLLEKCRQNVETETRFLLGGASRLHNEGCHAHISDYHAYPEDLIDYIGDRFYDWADEMKSTTDSDKTDDCPFSHYNIIECLKYFDVPEEYFNELYYAKLYYDYQYDPDVMYSGDEKKIRKLFENDRKYPSWDTVKYRTRTLKNQLKYRLSELGADEQTVAKYNELTLTDWTIPDIIRDAGITHSELKVFIMETDERIEDKEKKLHNAYDLDAIFRAVEEGEINYDADMTHLDRCRYNIEYDKQFVFSD